VADFLSIGTNDLTAEVLDLDRTDPRARPELTAHPYVLELVGRVVAGAAAAGRPVSVCGDAGAHPTTLPLLLGAGVRAVSVACARVDETRYRLRRLDATACAGLFAEALHLPDAQAAAALVRTRIPDAVPPAAHNGQPGTDAVPPAADKGQPGTDAVLPAAGNGRPGTDAVPPGGGNGPPGGGDRP